MKDYVIIGSGIIGSLIAKELSKYQVDIMVLEKENDVVNGQTVANSAIIHAGYDLKPGTLKAKLCVKGNAMYDDLEKELSIPLLKTGGLVVAKNEKELDDLKRIYDQAIQNGIKGVSIINQETLRKKEPHLKSSLVAALDLPTTKVTFPWQVAMAALTFAKANGAQIKTNAKVTNITYQNGMFQVEINDEEWIETKHIISCAGVFSDHIARMIEGIMPYQILPRKGEYYVLDKRVKGLFQHVIYPLPNKKGKGVLIVPQTHGNILLGPTSTDISDKEDLSTTREGYQYIREEVIHLSDDIPFEEIIRSFAGVRAKSTYEDFYIKASKKYPSFYHVAGIDSPGLTAAPAIASYLIEHILDEKLVLKKHMNLEIQGFKLFHEHNDYDKKALIQSYPKHGHIVCKCECVTEQDIIDAISHPIGSDTIKGIKKRVRAGSGLCQGGYCEHLVLKIIARETNQDVTKINYASKNSNILNAIDEEI